MITTPPKTQETTNGSPAAKQVRPMSAPDFVKAKQQGVRLTMLTAYDYTMAKLVDAAGVDGVLVGDSLGMVIQGNQDCLAVTLDEVIYHTKMVARGIQRCLLVADMPFMTFQVSAQQALENAGRLVKEGGAHAVKLEGGVRSAEAITAITDAGIPVMGHIGLTPQSIRRFGGFRVQRDRDAILADAAAAEKAGAFALVVECVPSTIADEITSMVNIPTIGIGAGSGCDGQILVTHDLLGLYDAVRPRFVKRYANLGDEIVRAVQNYCTEVRDGNFPDDEHAFA